MNCPRDKRKSRNISAISGALADVPSLRDMVIDDMNT